MKHALSFLLFSAALLLIPGCSSLIHPSEEGARRLSKNILGTVDESVFEVVVQKPVIDSLTYENPLPMDLIPFAMRNDRYYSIGTAFAVSADTFISCSHVINMDYATQYERYFLRDRLGLVYEIDSVKAYADNRDYIVFTVKNKTVSRWLKTRTDPSLNEDVFAVGNAFGEGIIVRDGVFTSKTPDSENGEWSWLRFSAAASPGNSGGPLLDRDGNIIGLISRKSENENLNYALPIGEVLGDRSSASRVHKKLTYTFPVIHKKRIQTLEWSTPLPEQYQALRAKTVKRIRAFCGEMLGSLLSENRGAVFPNGAGSEDLLCSNVKAFFPNLIAEKEDGNWSCFEAGKINSSQLGGGGTLRYADVSRYTFFVLKKPENVPLKKLYGDSTLFMNLILKGATLNREIAGNATRIVSLGAPKEDYIKTDSYGRNWSVKVWNQEYNDTKVIVYALPVPEGFAGILRIASTDAVDSDERFDLDALLDFTHLSYYGTMKQWNEYFADCTFLPPQLSSVKFSFVENQSLGISTGRCSLSLDKNLMPISPEADLSMRFAFFREGGKVVYDIGGMVIGVAKGGDEVYSIFRTVKSSGNDDDWKKIISSAHPYDGVPYVYNDSTYAAKVHSSFTPAGVRGKSGFLYLLKCITEGNADPAKVKEKLLRFESMTTVRDQ